MSHRKLFPAQFFVFIWLACLPVLYGCQNGCLKGQGKITTQKRSIGEFHTLHVYGWVDVILEKGSIPEVEIEAGKNLMANITTHAEPGSNLLVIRNDNKCHWSRGGTQPTIRLKYQNIAQIEQWGFGNIISVDTLKGKSLTVKIKGNGNVSLLVEVDNFSCAMLELGDLAVQGKSDRSYLFSHNVGFFKGKNFFTRYCAAHTRDEGEFEVNVSDTLTAIVESTGNIRYYGKPKVVQTTISGPGKVVAGE